MIDFGTLKGWARHRNARPRRFEPLTVTDAFKTFVLDQLDELGDVTPRAMFGGVGLYCRDVFFGIIARDVLYMKVDETNQPAYERAGMRPFMPYPDRDETARSKYYAVPTEILECGVRPRIVGAQVGRRRGAKRRREASTAREPRGVKKGPAVSRRSRRRD